MSIEEVIDDQNQLDPEKLEEYTNAAACVVEELRDFLGQYYLDLTKPPIVHGGHGFHGELPAAADNPAYAANIHRLKVAAENFVNAMRGNW